MSIYVLCIEENAFFIREGYQTEKATIEMLSHAPGDMQWLTIFKTTILWMKLTWMCLDVRCLDTEKNSLINSASFIIIPYLANRKLLSI